MSGNGAVSLRRLPRLSLVRHRPALCADGRHRATAWANRALGFAVVFVALAVASPSAQHAWLAALAERYSAYAAVLARAVQWLMRAPAGLKLHPTLGGFLGRSLAIYAEAHTAAVSALLESFDAASPAFWRVSGVLLSLLCGAIGVSGLLDIASDALLAAHWHLFVSAFVLGATWRGVRRVLLSLWRLFRGLKWNPLRGRVDTCRFSLDELLLGTLAFVLLCFLAPTIFVFHCFSVVALLPIQALMALHRGTARFLQIFPLRSAVLWLIDSPDVPRVRVLEVAADSSAIITTVCPSHATAPLLLAPLRVMTGCVRQRRRASFGTVVLADVAEELKAWAAERNVVAVLRRLVLAE